MVAKCAVLCLFMVHSLSPFQCPRRPQSLHSVFDLSSASFFLRSSIVRLEGRTGYLPLPLPFPFLPLLFARKAVVPFWTRLEQEAASSRHSGPRTSKRHAMHSSSACSTGSSAPHFHDHSSATYALNSDHSVSPGSSAW